MRSPKDFPKGPEGSEPQLPTLVTCGSLLPAVTSPSTTPWDHLAGKHPVPASCSLCLLLGVPSPGHRGHPLCALTNGEGSDGSNPSHL